MWNSLSILGKYVTTECHAGPEAQQSGRENGQEVKMTNDRLELCLPLLLILMMQVAY